MALYADICADGTQVTLTGTTLTFGATVVTLPVASTHVRAVSVAGVHFATVQGTNSTAYLVKEDGMIVTLGPIIGIRATAIVALATSMTVYWMTSLTAYSVRTYDTSLAPVGVATSVPIPSALQGTREGILDVDVENTVIFADARRLVTIKGYPLVLPVTRGFYWFGVSASFVQTQVMAVHFVTGRAYTLALGRGTDVHAVIGDGGNILVAFISAIGVATFAAGPPFPPQTGKLSPDGGDGVVGEGIQTLYALASHPLVIKESWLMTPEWYTFIVRLAQQIFSPVILDGATGVVGLSQGGTGGVDGGGVGITGVATDNLTLTGSGIAGDALEFGPTVARIFTAEVTLTDAQIKALPTTPVALVPAPATGLQNILLQSILISKFTAGAYTNVTAALSWMGLALSGNGVSSYIANDTTPTPNLTYLSTFLGATNSLVQLLPWQDTSDAGQQWGTLGNAAMVPVPAAALSIYADNQGNGDFTGGNAANTLKVITYYTIEDVS